MENVIVELGARVKAGEMSWAEAAQEYALVSGEQVSGDAVRKRYRRIANRTFKDASEDSFVGTIADVGSSSEFEAHLANGVIDFQKRVTFEDDDEKTPETILKKLGYSINDWEMIEWRVGSWEVGVDRTLCSTVRARIRPKYEELAPQVAVAIANEVFRGVEKAEPLKPLFMDYSDFLMEIPPVELHLGKLAWKGDTGENYDKDIASSVFNQIFERILFEQNLRPCSNALLLIGSDFFNSDTSDNTTTKGTQQYNDMRFQKMFKLGISLYVNAIDEMLKVFKRIDVKLVPGNHDYTMSFYLFTALAEHYRECVTIDFSEDHRDTQAFKFGKVGLFFNHGDTNLKRLQASIPAEFGKVWGETEYRELHLGHLHKEVVVDDEGGMITRRLGSPTGTDVWHYQNRFLGATKKQQIFVWSPELGMISSHSIPFPKETYQG